MYKKSSLVLAILTIVTLVLSACAAPAQAPAQATSQPLPAAATQPPAPADRKTTANTDQKYPKITIGINSDPQNLSPWQVNSGSKPYILHNFYENLFDFVNADYVPVLAKGYKVIDDLHWQVQIWDNIYDSAGNHITADDVVAAVNYVVSNKYAVRYDMFKEIKKVDDYTVEYTWTRAITGVGDLEHPFCRTPIYSQKAFQSGNFATQPVATGPYVVKEYVSGSKVVLEANPKYWQTDKSRITKRHQAHVQTIQYNIITEASQYVIGLQTGTLDFTEYVPTENLADFQAGGKFADKYKVWVTSGSQLWGMSCNASPGNPCNDLNFRLAVWYAIDNEAVSKATRTTVASKAFGTDHFSDYVKAWDSKPNYINTYDPKLAKDYLAKTKYDGRTLKFNSRSDEPGKTMATVIQSFLTNIGIKAEINLMSASDQGALWAKADTWDLMLWQIGGGNQIGEYNRVMNNLELGNGMSMGFIKDDKLQELFVAARTAKTHDDAHMTALHDYVLQNAYLYAVGAPKINMVYTSKLAEVVLRENEFFLPGGSNYFLD